MTERLYYVCDAVEGRARVMGCREEPDGRYAVELDRTLFHPGAADSPRIVAGWRAWWLRT